MNPILEIRCFYCGWIQKSSSRKHICCFHCGRSYKFSGNL